MSTALDEFFTIKVSSWGQPRLEASRLSSAACRAIRSVVLNNLTSSEDYKQRQNPAPFLQGYDPERGWVLVEFWGRDIEPYVEYLRTRIPEWLRESGFNSEG